MEDCSMSKIDNIFEPAGGMNVEFALARGVKF